MTINEGVIMGNNERSAKFNEIEEEFQRAIITNADFEGFCDKVVETAKAVTEASIALLYLTPDHKILEAMGQKGEPVEQVEPTQIPFYRLDWNIGPGDEKIYDGFTAWATLHLAEGEVGVLRYENELNNQTLSNFINN